MYSQTLQEHSQMYSVHRTMFCLLVPLFPLHKSKKDSLMHLGTGLKTFMALEAGLL